MHRVMPQLRSVFWGVHGHRRPCRVRSQTALRVCPPGQLSMKPLARLAVHEVAELVPNGLEKFIVLSPIGTEDPPVKKRHGERHRGACFLDISEAARYLVAARLPGKTPPCGHQEALLESFELVSVWSFSLRRVWRPLLLQLRHVEAFFVQLKMSWRIKCGGPFVVLDDPPPLHSTPESLRHLR